MYKEFSVGNDFIGRTISFKESIPVKSTFTNKKTGYSWENNEDAAALNIPGFDWDGCKVSFNENSILFESNLSVLWEFIVLPDMPVIETRISVKGKPFDNSKSVSAENSSGVELGKKKSDIKTVNCETIENISSKNKHLKLEIVEFFDATDDCNTLVTKSNKTMYFRNRQEYSGHIFIIDDYINKEECVIIKNAPCAIAHLNKTNSDLIAFDNCMWVSGSGIDYSRLSEDEYTHAYSVAIGLCEQGGSRELFRKYYTHYYPLRTTFILSNTWGDRNQDKCICEEFILKEIDRGAELGIDVVQIDDGWETGTTANSALATGGAWGEGYYSQDGSFWEVNAKKFPRGMKYITDYAAKKNVEIGLWFSPDATDDYGKNHDKDLKTLLDIREKYNIRYFKFDGIRTTSKKSEYNTTSLFEKLTKQSNGEIIINSDITAGKRLGYLCQKEYVNLFVENRYTDWANYYPHNTLRNLWQLSEFIPACKLQMEVLNLRRNADRYNDCLAPDNYDMDYVFASVMVANPLIWMEMYNLNDEDSKKLSGIISVYKKYREDFLDVTPIGECPDGFSMTGFSIKGKTDNYVIILRELSEKDTFPCKIKEVLYTNDDGLKVGAENVTFSKHRSFVFAKA